MKTSLAGRQAIARHEGNKLKAYPDPATGGEPFTIGVGHTSAAGPPKVTKGMTITAAESDAILTRDLATFERAVEKAVKVPVTQAQFDAMVSLAFNIGGGAFAKSTLVKKLNAGDVTGAANAFLSWNKAAGKVMKGLTTRREAERKLFMSNSAQAPQPTAAKPVETAPVRTDSILSRGSRGPIVSDLQRNLNTLGYGPLKVDEHFGGETEKAVMSFQLDNGLKVDGIAGGRTSTAIGKAIKDRETAPKIAAAKDVVDDAASKGGISKTEVAAGVVAVSGAAKAADEIKTAVDSARGLTETLWSLGPWILVGLLTVAAGIYIYHDRRRKRIAADAAKEMM